jgi:flagellar biosynthesis regulator FlaF
MNTKNSNNKHLNGSQYLQTKADEPAVPNLTADLNKTLDASKKMLQMVASFPNSMKSSGNALGIKQQIFIKTVFELAQEDNQLLPHEFEAETLDSMLEQVKSLMKIRQNVEQINKKIKARLHELACQEQQICSKIYGLIQSFAVADVPGMQELHDQLKLNYQKNRKKSESTAPKTTFSGYEEKNGDLLLMQKKTERGVRIRKNKAPLGVILHQDRKIDKV